MLGAYGELRMRLEAAHLLQHPRPLARVLRSLRRAEASAPCFPCLDCGHRIAPALAELGSLRCHDCRARQMAVAASD
jgi:hypothetical protein